MNDCWRSAVASRNYSLAVIDQSSIKPAAKAPRAQRLLLTPRMRANLSKAGCYTGVYVSLQTRTKTRHRSLSIPSRGTEIAQNLCAKRLLIDIRQVWRIVGLDGRFSSRLLLQRSDRSFILHNLGNHSLTGSFKDFSIVDHVLLRLSVLIQITVNRRHHIPCN